MASQFDTMLPTNSQCGIVSGRLKPTDKNNIHGHVIKRERGLPKSTVVQTLIKLEQTYICYHKHKYKYQEQPEDGPPRDSLNHAQQLDLFFSTPCICQGWLASSSVL